MTKRERERIEKKILKIKLTAAATSFGAGEQFALAFLFCLPSDFRGAIENDKTIKTVDDFLVAMYKAIQVVMNKPAQQSDFPGLFALWNSTTSKVDTSDPEFVSYAFIYTYTTPPCPRGNDQQPAILKALLNGNIPA